MTISHLPRALAAWWRVKLLFLCNLSPCPSAAAVAQHIPHPRGHFRVYTPLPSNSMRTLSASLPPNLHWSSSGPWSRPQKSTFLFGTSRSADWNRGPVNRARSVLSQALPLWWEVWGRGKGAIPSGDFPGARTPSRPPRSSLSPAVDQNKRSPPLSQNPRPAARNTPGVLPIPPATPAPRGKEGQQPSFSTAAVSPGGAAPARRPARHREVASGPLLRRCSLRDEAGGRERFGG